jgi:hypothetical protein
MDYFTLLTQTGATKITAAATNNTTVNLTHIAVGDGAGSVVMPDASQTALVGETYKTQLSDLKIDDNNSNWLVAVGYIPSDIGNFWVREVGIFDEDGDLIAVGNYPETFKPVMANNVAKDLYISVIMETSNAEAVTLEIDPSIVMASRLYVEENFSNKQHNHNNEYAALNGSELQRFKVADAEGDDEAVSRSQMYAKYSGFKNYIINGGFDIWQMGNSFSTSGHTADMWNLYYTANATKTIINNINGINITTSNINPRINQKLENGLRFSNKTFTLSFYAKYANSNHPIRALIYYVNNGVQVGSGDLILEEVATTTLQRFQGTFTFRNVESFNPDNSYIDIHIDAGESFTDTLTVTQVQLEEGTIPTSFEQRPIGLEMLLCQRYLFFVGRKYGNVGYSGQCTSATRAYVSIPFPVEMRTVPTFVNGGSLAVFNANETNNNVISVAVGADRFCARMQLTVASGLVAGNATILSYTNPSNSYFDARL